MAALVLSTALPACGLLGGADDGSPLGAGPVASTAPGADERAAAAEAALSAAAQAWSDGDALAAMALATRALREGVPPEYEAALRRIRTEARAALVEQQVAELTVLPERDALSDGDDVRGAVRVRNRSSAPVVVPRTAADSSESQVVLEVVRRDYDVYGNVRTTEFVRRVPLVEDLRLGPGGTASVPFVIPAESARLSHTGFATLEIGGHLRAVSVLVGATELFDALPLEPAVVRVLMAGFEPLADDPFESLRLAVLKRSPPHIVTAAELLAPAERERGVRLLEAAAEEDPPLAFVCRATAARLNALLEAAPR